VLEPLLLTMHDTPMIGNPTPHPHPDRKPPDHPHPDANPGPRFTRHHQNSRCLQSCSLHRQYPNPVWSIVEARSLGYSEADLLTSYPTLTATDLAQAWIYAEAHSEAIATAIQINEAA
jgi:hypothetical protein